VPTSAIAYFKNQKLEPVFKPLGFISAPAAFPASVNYKKGMALGELTGTNSKQSLTPSTGANAITGGTYKLTFASQQTAAIAATANAQEIQAALQALSSIGNGNVYVTGGPLMSGDVFIEFVGAMGGAAQTAITVQSSLTSGGTAAVTVNATLQTGSAGTPGTYKAYQAGNTDGSGKVDAILAYDIQTDSSGNVMFSDTSGQVTGEFLQQYLDGLVYLHGFFNIADLFTTAGQAGCVDGLAVTGGGNGTGASRLRVVQGSLAINKGIVKLN
jgi:hypothetical protein